MGGFVQKNFHAANETEVKVCNICEKDFREADNITPLDCNVNHYFHYDCLDMWLEQGNTECPVCKTRID